jgi:hypothetical protein
VVVEVVSAPAARPARAAACRLGGRREGGAAPRPHAGRDEREHDDADGNAERVGGQHAEQRGADEQPGQGRDERDGDAAVDLDPSPLALQDEQVHHQPEDQEQCDGAGRRQGDEDGWPGEQREPESRRRLQRGREQQRDPDERERPGHGSTIRSLECSP